jgi:hypothetical protein
MIVSEPGFYPDMTADEYFADPCPLPSLTQSLIPTLINRSPYHFAHAHKRLNPYGAAPEATKTMWLGSAAHRLALGRGREISTIRYPDYRHSSARADRDLAIANGRIPVLEGELIKARAMADVLKGLIGEIVDDAPYETEVVMIWQEMTQYGPIWCRGMADLWCLEKAILGDPKGLQIPATADDFGRIAATSGYDVQAVFYRRGIVKLLPELKDRARFINLVVENTPPHGAAAFELDAASLYIAERQVAMAMELFAKCLHHRSWPSYPKGVQTLSTPQWYQNKVINS